jgi:2-phosphosulfolactate phosphatase
VRDRGPASPEAGPRPASIDIAFTPAEVGQARVAVVVDVLRASSTIVAALGAGFERVLCTATPEGAWQLRGDGRALAGERGCRRIEGFDYGNSPQAFERARAERPGARELVLCTTNGTPAVLAAAQAAEHVLVGSLLNLDALIAAIPAGGDVTIVCSGTDGRFALEDAYTAGRIVARLSGARSDAALAAERLASSYPDAREPLARSADAAVLRATGQAADIAYCARESVSAVVPQVGAASTSTGVAVVSARERPRPLAATPPATNRQSLMEMARSFT